jgi:GNAT superfamily N-acetyltransferase
MVAETEFWTPLQLYTQRRMRELSSFLCESPALVSDGRYVSLYLRADMPASLAVGIVEEFGRAMVCGPAEAVRRAGDALRLGGCEVLADLAYMAGDAGRVAGMAGNFRDAFALPSGLSCHALTDDCADDDVRVIQRLQLAGELVPLPRGGLFDARAAAVILRTMAGEVVGFSSVFNLERAGERLGWYQMGGVCVDAAWRGLGLGSYMTACAILQAAARGDARHFIASVHEENLASVKMHRSCGMDIDADFGFLFARISRAREAALLGAG